MMSINALKIGQSGVVRAMHIEGAMRRRLMDLGLIPGTHVTCVGESPFSDPRAYYFGGAVIALRVMDGKNILIGGDEN